MWGNKLIIKVDADASNSTYGIKCISYYRVGNSNESFYSMVHYIDVSKVITAFSKHEMPFLDVDSVIVEFDNSSYIEVDFHPENKMQHAEKLISDIFKLRMFGTKWAEEHPEKYV